MARVFGGMLAIVISPIVAFPNSGSFDSSFFANLSNRMINTLDRANALLFNTKLVTEHYEFSPLLSELSELIENEPINNGTLMLYTPVELNFEELEETEEPEEIEDSDSESEPITAPVISQNITVRRSGEDAAYSPYQGTIVRRTFRPSVAGNYVHLYDGGQVRNGSRSISAARLLYESRLPLTFGIKADISEPQVLIIHTHTTESFAEVSDTFRSLDADKNIVAIGAVIAEEIARAGFGVVHDGTIHDYPVFNGSYSRSEQTITTILERYPSINIVLDIHRDAVESNGAPVAAVTNTTHGEAAQIMIISAADNGEWGVPNFMHNFRFANRLQSQLENDHPGITRALWFKYSNYNQHLTPASLLIEVGTHGNTLDQTLISGRLLGESIGNLLTTLAELP